MMSRDENDDDDDKITEDVVSHAEMRAMLWGRQRESNNEQTIASHQKQNSSGRTTRPASLSEEWKELKRLRSSEDISGTPSITTPKMQTKVSVWTNFIALCTGLMMASMSFLPLRNIQTSLHEKHHLGTISLTFIYGSFMIGCVISPWLIQNARPKGLILLSLSTHVLYIAANLLPSFFTLLPASVVFGFLQAPLWSVQELLMGSYGSAYSTVTGIRIERSIQQFQSVFLVFCHSAQIFGNLLQSVVLKIDDKNDIKTYTRHKIDLECDNKTHCVDNINSYDTDMKFGERFMRLFTKWTHQTDYLEILLLIYLSLACCSVFLIGCCLKKPDIIIHKRKTKLCEKVFEVLSFFRTKTFLMLGFLMIFTGMQQGVVISDVTKMYATDTLGLGMIGYIMMCYGTSQLAMLLIIEKLQKRLKPVVFVLKGFLISQGLLILLYIWEPNADSVYTIMGFMALWGAVDAVWQSQVQGILVSSAVRKEAAVICFRVCQGFGLCVVFASSVWLTLLYRICLVGSTLLLGVISYMILEVTNNPVTPLENKPFYV